MHFVGVGFLYFGLILALTAAVSFLGALRFLALHNRRRRTMALAVGLILALCGALLPADEARVSSVRTLLDEFAPVYQFNEVHEIRIRAPRQRIYRAIKEVTANEIFLFHTLTWIRRFGRSGPEHVLNAPGDLPLLDVATRTTFLLLAEEADREIVVGTAVMAPPEPRVWERNPQGYKSLDAPGYAKATMNFRIERSDTDSCTVTTETRIFATDASARRRFAAYWRTIYPGSALIRRMWLRAIRDRAES
jgi:hypothetical protein